jgi:cbb3-type cytochrome oxidase subunit 1
MDWFARWFVKASLAWLCVGVTLGLAMAAFPAWTIYRPAHMHATLLGFVTMMVYGVGYHVFPRFTGHRLRSSQLAGAHWWIANAGLSLMMLGFALRVSTRVPVGAGIAALVAGGTLSAIGAFAFAWNVWATLDAAQAARQAPIKGSPARPLQQTVELVRR